MSQKIGVVDVGGGLRGIYAAGIFDYCLDNHITFDLGIGVSAGSANLASFIAKQPRRNLTFFAEYAMRKEYMGWGNFLRKKSFIDLDYVYGTLCNADGEYPLDYQAITGNPMELYVVASDAYTGKAKYFTKNDLSQDCYDIFKASCAIPFVCKPYTIQGTPYYDGALADPVPIKKAFELGCDKVILILTLPKDTQRSASKDKMLANRIRKQYPLSAACLAQRYAQYNETIALAKEYEREGKLLIIAPDDTCGVDTLSRDPEALRNLYAKGYRDAECIRSFATTT